MKTPDAPLAKRKQKNIADALMGFVEVHKRLLDVVIGKVGLLDKYVILHVATTYMLRISTIADAVLMNQQGWAGAIRSGIKAIRDSY